MHQNWNIGCGILIYGKRGGFLFDSITDIFLSIIGITILLICFNTFFVSIFNTMLAKKIISYLSFIGFTVFVVGGLLFGRQNEDPFYIGFLIFLLVFGFVILICMLKNFITTIRESMEIQEIEKQCRSCKYFDECDECFIKDCPYYEMAEPEEFEEDL